MRVLLAALAVVSSVALAQPATAQTVGKPASGPTLIKTAPLGVKPPLREGVYADLQVGTFFTLNGGAANGNKAVSNAEPLLGLAVGYDITRNITAGVGFAYGASAGSCYGTFQPTPGATNPCVNGADSFAVLSFNVFAGYLHPVTYAWFLGAKVEGGLALMTPKPIVPQGQDTAGVAMGFDGGLMLTTEYHTHLDHFVIGLDVGGEFFSGGNGVGFPGIAIYPHLKYVF